MDDTAPLPPVPAAPPAETPARAETTPASEPSPVEPTPSLLIEPVSDAPLALEGPAPIPAPVEVAPPKPGRLAFVSKLWRNDLFGPALSTLIGMGVVLLVFGYFTFPYAVQGNYDEGFEAAVVERVIDGHGLPYVDGVAHRGPFLYWTQAVFHLVFGRFEWLPSRLMSITCALLTMTLMLLTGWATKRPLAGAIAGLLHAFMIATMYDTTGIGITAEHPGLLFLTGAFFCMAYALERAKRPRVRGGLLFASGALLAMAALSKQTLAVGLLPLGTWAFFRPLADAPLTKAEGRWPWRTWLATVGLFAAGGLVLVGLVLARYAAAGELGTFWFWFVSFNSKFYMAPYDGVLAQMGQWLRKEGTAIVAIAASAAVILGPTFSRLERWSPRGWARALGGASFEVAAGLALPAVLFGAVYPLRIWQHYFVPVWPFAGLVLGLVVEALVVQGAPRPRLGRGLAAFAFAVMVAIPGLGRFVEVRERGARGEWPDHRPDPVCEVITQVAGPGRRAIFIWGTIGDLYVTCQRRSASYFTYTTVVAGLIPPFWNQLDPKRVAPGSRERIIDELTKDQTPVLIDHPISIPGSMMMDIPQLADFVNAHYCRLPDARDKRGRVLAMYGLKSLPACAPAKPPEAAAPAEPAKAPEVAPALPVPQ